MNISLWAARCAATIVFAGLTVAAHSPDTLAKSTPSYITEDKLLHAFGAFLATIAGLYALPRLSPLLVAGGVFLAGLGLELMQIHTERNADFGDGAFNGAGCALALLAHGAAGFRNRQNGKP
jgi:hypothetical protein